MSESCDALDEHVRDINCSEIIRASIWISLIQHTGWSPFTKSSASRTADSNSRIQMDDNGACYEFSPTIIRKTTTTAGPALPKLPSPLFLLRQCGKAWGSELRRKPSSPIRVVTFWDRLTTSIVTASSVNAFKRQLDSMQNPFMNNTTLCDPLCQCGRYIYMVLLFRHRAL